MAKRQIQNASGESPSESDSEEARQPKRQCQQATTTISTAGLSNQVIPEPTQSDSEPAIGVAAYPTLDTWEVEPLTSPEVSPKSTPQPSPQPSLSRPPTPQASSPPSFPQLPFWADFDADIDEFARTELDPPDLLDRTLAWHQSGYAPELHPYPYVWISYVWYMFIIC